MNFDDYATHIYQKLRLAIALAIIRSKPTNISTDEYLNELKSKMVDKMEDDDVTVCSDDFLMDDDDLNDSVNLLKDFDLKDLENDGNILESNVIEDQNKNVDSVQDNDLQNDLTQMTLFDNSQIVTQNSSNDITMHEENSKNHQKVTKTFDSNNKNQESETAIADSYHKNLNELNTAKIDSTYYDSQKTILYSVHGLTQNYTHFSPSQTDLIIPQQYIYGVKENRTTNNPTTAQNIESNVSNDCSTLNNKNNALSRNPRIVEEVEFTQNRVVSQNVDGSFDVRQKSNYINSASNNSTSNTITSKNNELYFQKSQDFVQSSQNAEEFFEDMQNINKHGYYNDSIVNKTPRCINISNMDETLIFSQNDNHFPLNKNSKDTFEEEIYLHNNSTVNDHQIIINNRVLYNLDTKTINSKTNSFKNQESETATHDSYSINQESNAGIDFTHNDSQNRLQYNVDEIEFNDSKELVSYKVLEEFNKVKMYLRRTEQNRRLSCDGYSTDSGYRSDSQIRSSNRSALQLSDNWLNQSACCLFNYIMQCPLVAATRDITNEIAQVLSQLIDKLHEEEKYPSFLEDLLETIDLLLQQIYSGSNSENEFLTTDANIQRILLLNKSIHVQQHTIEEITKILEIFHTKVTEKDTTFELTNIEEIENVSYIFHILEILLKIYIKNKEILSQSSQQSQEEEKILKKSSISAIWRKKWNPSQKVFEGSKEKKCVLKVCSDVLNKIVVDCVSNYSLVAYSALKCFNSMQS